MKNLTDLVDERLWAAVKKNYTLEQYSNAVEDGIQFLGDLIREMSGEDGDGVNLIGRVFNEKNPKIKVNKLNTQTDKDIQRGVMFLLQGFYSAIRNERAHTKKDDTLQEAYELILFINHVLRIIDNSKGKYTVENTLTRVFDENFLATTEYANYLVKEIPKNKKFEVALEIFRNRDRSKNLQALSVFWNLIKQELNKEELKEIYTEASEIARFENDDEIISSIVIFMGNDWDSLQKDSRLRAENLLINNLPSYLVDDPREQGPSGVEFQHVGRALYSLYINELMLLEKEFAGAVLKLLKKRGYEMTSFVFNHFGGLLEELSSKSIFENFDSITEERLKNNDTQFKELMRKFYPNKLELMLPEKPTLNSNFDEMDDDLPF